MKGERAAEPLLLWLRLLGVALVPLVAQRVYAPLVVLGFLSPLPLAFGSARRGPLEGILAASLGAVGAWALFGPEMGPAMGASFALENIPLAVAVPWAARGTRPPHHSVILGSALVLAVSAGGALLSGAVAGQSPAEVFREVREGVVSLAVRGPGTPTPGAPEEGSQGAIPPEAAETIKRLLPGTWVASTILLFLFYTLFVRGWLSRGAGKVPPGGIGGGRLALLRSWSLPFPLVGVFVAVSLAVVLGKGGLREAGLNSLIILAALYGIQGMAVLGHFLEAWRMPPMAAFLGLALLLTWFPLGLGLGMALLGLLDTWYDFRRRFPVKEPPPQDPGGMGPV